ncbi:hypothetical protein [Virgisporangium aurantiacum]|uniref:Thioesterase domain-containing protein n=1 Tax=Virgisporangium aurantiacum TaxID=175570 RepID=A0A8J3YZC4_9ACTN|nr:hypothetical protein [Virgisporangium aurantiacum]GIJ54799.1 hypothetical protein Vau01_023150 [Virgisporangium aurantiacum]
MTENLVEQAVPVGWTALSQPGELVVACDFASAGRPIATFTDLVSLLPPGFSVWESAPPAFGAESGMDGAAHVERWAGALATLPVRAVLGFCSGSVYAGMIADRIAARQPRPRLVLLDPEPATPAMMLDFYRERVNRFASVLAPDEVAAALRAGEDSVAASSPPLALAARLRDLCHDVVAPACERVGLPGSRVTEFVGLAGSYLHWLAAAIDLPARWPTAHAVNCATPGIGLRSVPPADRAGLVASARYLDVSHTDLMRSPLTARAVADLLTE